MLKQLENANEKIDGLQRDKQKLIEEQASLEQEKQKTDKLLDNIQKEYDISKQ